MRKMGKYPSDVSVSKNCIDANLKMVERQDPDNIPRFPPQEWCKWSIHEIALKICIERKTYLAKKEKNNYEESLAILR